TGARRGGSGLAAAPCSWWPRSHREIPASPGSASAVARAKLDGPRQYRGGPVQTLGTSFFECQPQPIEGVPHQAGTPLSAMLGCQPGSEILCRRIRVLSRVGGNGVMQRRQLTWRMRVLRTRRHLALAVTTLTDLHHIGHAD